MSAFWVFDLDGVLANTRDYVREAYRMIGVEQPDDAWGKPASEWIPDDYAKIQKMKNDAYEVIIRVAPLDQLELPLCAVARAMVHDGRPAGVLTGASLRATRLLLEVLNLDLEIVGTGCGTDQKIDRLRRLAVRYPRGFYVDDNDGVTVPDGWEFIRWMQ